MRNQPYKSSQEIQYLGDELAHAVLGTIQEQIVRSALNHHGANLGRVDEVSCEGAEICRT